MKHFGLYIHPNYAKKDNLYKLLDDLRQVYHIQLYGFQSQQSLLPSDLELYGSAGEHVPKLDCILVFGGDGTILRAKDYALGTGAPILGINLGYLGFLSESSLQDLHKSINDLLQHRFILQKRMLLNAQLKREGKVIYRGLALNDAVIYKAETPRLINIRVYNNHRYVVDTRCDGIITSTPTGSTAYSLSAGGPILSPVMSAIIVNPINPHILSIRPMVFPEHDKLAFKVHELDNPAWLQIDGINVFQMHNNDELLVTADKKTVKFIKLTNRTFFKILRNKLHLGK